MAEEMQEGRSSVTGRRRPGEAGHTTNRINSQIIKLVTSVDSHFNFRSERNLRILQDELEQLASIDPEDNAKEY